MTDDYARQLIDAIYYLAFVVRTGFLGLGFVLFGAMALFGSFGERQQ